ncbi:Tetratricopeptide TPR_2 repeat-containing protein [Caldithrix abyssi DSM 13497]|uniref:Tetratricopeptide TPR_2 repeat-containing protein n=2 Tax=Caldithrix abyssi DSM 13497 TaxID=880073 RepID=H1XT91_CALAY|nr:tetratricopeptide repeat protein [Caldithrix abyssi]EHO42658.1 Tetratricopeptide TPR_2 repeat-containing protein [Caldithrix abyssi DSM 13497]
MNSISKNFLVSVFSIFLLWSCYNMDPPVRAQQPSAFYFYQMAVQSKIRGDTPKALEQINRAIRLNHKISLFYVFKAQIFDSMQVSDSAVFYYKKSLTLRSHAPEILKRLGELALQAQRPNEAAYYFRKAYIEAPDSVDFLLKLAQIRLQQNEIRQAENLLDEYRLTQKRKERPVSPLFFVIRADLAMSKGDSLSAARFYARSHCGECLSKEQAEWAFETLLKTQNLEAYFDLLAGVRKNRHFPEALLYYYRGLYYQAIGNAHEAVQQFERAYQKGVRKKKLLKMLIQFYAGQNKMERVKVLQSEIQE